MKALAKLILGLFPRTALQRLADVLLPVLDLWYRGNTFTDPINGKSYRKFLPYGYVKIRPNVLSPGTLSLERHRLIWLYLKKETEFFQTPSKVLHMAPEKAFISRLKKLSHLDYISCDIESPLADIKADICALPFDDNSFDWILCNHVLEHIPSDTKAMQELYRVLKPGGKALLQVPLDPKRDTTFEDNSITDKATRTKIFGQYDHVRVYGKDYFEKLRAIGFRVNELQFGKTLSKDERTRYAIVKTEYIPVCERPIEA
ncbi:MAG: Ubiquinone/menaquinone biosynthesis C-methyltransferase UbiE [Flavobacteriales bacterium]|jgi:SAM-dependent methyltransferase|nr:MAG: class I SAM-dependent methyltransferase [Flavobacteriales bacterium]CAI8275034.1 MAG: Ubiquinone/menaquinone biosynthesis C-methyltransferase UbiE [Flavobacteriales bacterium]|tara:strand:+ start:1924 stop:2700 length:777 start_codon:yes stop_codon:yes gene_type:complete